MFAKHLTLAETVNLTVCVCPAAIKIKSIVAVLCEVKREKNDSNKNPAVRHCKEMLSLRRCSLVTLQMVLTLLRQLFTVQVDVIYSASQHII